MPRSAGTGLFVLMLLAAVPPGATAADLLIPQDGSGGDVPLVQQGATAAPGSPPVQLIPTTPFVEDPTRQAGGEDDAQRASERANERTNEQGNDDGDHRRK